MEIKNKVLRGAAVVFLEQGGIKIIGVIGTIILSRLLFPADFGLIATASIAVNFFTVFIRKGISLALIQKKEQDDELLSTCLFLYGAMGVFFSVFLFLFAPWIAVFFHMPVLQGILRVLSPVLFIRSFSAVPVAIIQRRLDFVRSVIPTLAGSVIYVCVAVFLAWSGSGVWSFVWAILASSLVSMGLNWAMSLLRPRLFFSWSKFKSLLKFGIPALFVELVEYSGAHVDYFIIAKFLGPVALGFYALAYQFSDFFYSKVSVAMTKVFFPVFCNLENAGSIRHYYLKIVFYLGMIILPFYAAGCLLNKEVVWIVYGAKWAEAALPLGILSILGVVKGVCLGVGNRDILYSQGRPDTFLKLRIMGALLNAVAVLIGVGHGIVGVAISVTCAGVISALYTVVVVSQSIDIGWKEYAFSLIPSVVATIIMGGVILLLKPWLSYQIGSIVAVAALGATAYVTGLYLMGIHVWRDIADKWGLLFSKQGKDGGLV